jgi:hypothetical protein
MYFSDLPFACLRKLLLDLGFTEHVVDGNQLTKGFGVQGKKYLAFNHPESDTSFLFRFYRPQDNVSRADLVNVRSQLAWRGLLSEDAFDASLKKASA